MVRRSRPENGHSQPRRGRKLLSPNGHVARNSKPPQERKFLGFSFCTGPEIKRMIAPKALERFKHRIRDTTRRAKGVSMETTIAELAPYPAGLA